MTRLLPEEPTDYPAAHSMDTSWYAVDSEGHIAEFETGETGVLPEIAAEENRNFDLLLILANTPSIDCYVADALEKKPNITVSNLKELSLAVSNKDLGKSAWQSFGADRKLSSNGYTVKAEGIDGVIEISVTEEVSGKRSSSFYDIIVIGSDYAKLVEALPQTERPEANPLRLNCSVPSDKQLIFLPTISLQNLSQLLEQGLVEEGWDYFDLSLRRFGVFTYESGDYVCSDRYTFETAPHKPIRVNEIPERMRELIEGVRFGDVQFSRGEEVWPRRYYRCRGWHAEI